ncbi:AraC family transcriptional regulator [Pelomonas sp. KK5]|uniref:helix-turn-helix transcriptional regulator n=1 Tax=Pelomonas sp. KK5 TaxID=1855730 RepID=UPI0009FB30D4|nr:AraC family transcriptional regulator [Pelomonas sp. KK5]
MSSAPRPVPPASSIWPTHVSRVSEIWTEPADLDEHVRAGIAERLGPQAHRLNAAAVGSSGTQVSVFLSDVLRVQLSDWTPATDTRLHFLADRPLLALRASLASDSAYAVPGLPPMLFNRPEIVLTYVPLGAQLIMDTAAHRRFHGVIALIEATAFLRSFELPPEAVPENLREALAGRSSAGRLITLPLDARLAQLVALMTTPPRDPALLALFVGGKLRELVALMLDAAWRNPQFAGPGATRPQDLDLAHAAREVLDREYAKPPRIPELAARLGTNQNRLATVFREAFQTTMQDHCIALRIVEAQRLLLAGHLSIGQVAEQVGYEHQSSFTTAFKALAGMSPREYQQQRAALDVLLGPGFP